MQLIRICMFFILLVFNQSSYAHFQSPITIKQISLTGNQLVKIEIGNETDRATYFDIELDGYIINSNFKVGAENNRSYSTMIQGIEPSKIQEHKLCSISSPKNGSNLRTRICTNIKLLYPKKKIEVLINGNKPQN